MVAKTSFAAILMANTAFSLSSLAITGNAFCHFPPYDTPTFKTKVLQLTSYEGQVKRLLLRYKRLIQPYISLLWQ